LFVNHARPPVYQLPCLGKHHPVWSELVCPWTPRVLPAVLQALAQKDAGRIFNRIPLHAIDDVVDMLEPGLGEQVDGDGAAAARINSLYRATCP